MAGDLKVARESGSRAEGDGAPREPTPVPPVPSQHILPTLPGPSTRETRRPHPGNSLVISRDYQKTIYNQP